MRYATLFVVLAGAALALSWRYARKHTRRADESTVSEMWLFKQRGDDQ
jgi:hypothetical protein